MEMEGSDVLSYLSCEQFETNSGSGGRFHYVIGIFHWTR